jgi:hypothetical protein
MHDASDPENADGVGGEGQPPAQAGEQHARAPIEETIEGGAQGLSEIAGSLQERLAAHGRKLADAAGGTEAEAQQRVGGFAQHFAFAENEAEAAAPIAADERLAFDEPAHLPWLESADAEDDEGAVDTRRVALFVAAGLALLSAIVGGIWWSTHRSTGDARVADGSVIAAPAQPYKTAPAQPGGKTYEGTGASSFAVSQGHNPTAHLAGGEAAADAGPAANAAAKGGTAGAGTVKTPAEAGAVAIAAAKAAGSGGAAPSASAGESIRAGATSAGGTGVQVGAYTSQSSAEAGWNKLVRQYAPLGEVHHRIVQGQADIGTVYRLQAVPASESAANTLCSAMKAQGMACQVKR